MLKEAKNIWPLLLPLFIVTSFLLQDENKLKVLNVNVDAYTHLHSNNFFSVEEKVNALYVIKNNKLVIDATTEKNLSKAIDDITLNPNNIMFEKTYPSSQGKKLLQLISCYRLYKIEEQSINKLQVTSQADQLVDYRVLQQDFFGPLATDLFSDHHAFYESAEASGITLVPPPLNKISVPAECSEISDVK